ncbi:hypothetical protein DRN58_03415, partial [Thermococci archaeon]
TTNVVDFPKVIFPGGSKYLAVIHGTGSGVQYTFPNKEKTKVKTIIAEIPSCKIFFIVITKAVLILIFKKFTIGSIPIIRCNIEKLFKSKS